MATATLKENKKGEQYYEIMAYRVGKSRLSTRWYIPDGWSAKSIERELERQKADFQRRADAGEVLSRKELKAIEDAERERKAEAERRAREEAERIVTLKQYGERVFMPTKAVTCSENTRASFQGMLNKNIYPVLGDRKLIDITSADITSLLVAYQAKGRKHASVVKMYTVLRLLFGMAYNADVIERNPMNKVERPKPRKDESRNTEIQAYTADELRSIINALDGEPLKWRTIMRLIIDTGIRRGECCGLRWQDIDFDNNLITINGTLGYTAERGIFYNTPKNGKSRVIDVDASIMKMLKEMRAEQVSTVMSEYVFTQEGSAEPMHPQSPARYMQKFGERNGIEKLHPHKLRHSFASVAITNNADIASVSEKLGHTDKATTLRMYTHADTESMKRASNIFRDALKLEEKRA